MAGWWSAGDRPLPGSKAAKKTSLRCVSATSERGLQTPHRAEGPRHLAQLRRDGQRDAGGFGGSQHCATPRSCWHEVVLPTGSPAGTAGQGRQRGHGAATAKHAQSRPGPVWAAGMNWDSLTPSCITMSGPMSPEPPEAGGDGGGAGCGTGQVLGSRAGHQPAPLRASPVSLPPSHAGPNPADTPTKIPSPPPAWGTSEPHHCCHTGESGVRKERQGPALEPSPPGSASHRYAGSSSPSQGVPPAPAPPDTQGSQGGF